MTVKRYDTRIGNSMGLNVPCSEMYSNPVGQFVTYSDYQKLVAENAALKDSANFYRMGFKPTKGAFGIEYKPTEALLEDCGNNAMDALKTPATDAAIADIGAKAIENAINSQSGKPCIIDKTNGLAYINLGGIQDFAANLSAGRKG